MAESAGALRVWLTRPAGQNEAWAEAARRADAAVAVEPLLAITEPADPELAKRALARAERADVVIATSRNAIASACRLRPGFSPRGALFGVGAGSATALGDTVGAAADYPERPNSESLLALPKLHDVKDRDLALLAGEGGRALLARTLAERGANVEKIAVYRRRGATIPAQRLRQLLAWVDVVVVTSGEAMVRLATEADRVDGVQGRPRRVIVPGPRVADMAPAWLAKPVFMQDMSVMALTRALAQVRRAINNTRCQRGERRT